MKIFILPLLILCLWVSPLYAQPGKIAVNPAYEKAPRKVARSSQKLAEFLTKDESSDHQKALNIYTWIVNNIKYEVKALRKRKTKSYTPKQTLRRKKGVCYQYSDLFATLCQYADISAKEIIGYSRGAGYQEDDPFYESDHSWIGVKLDSSWYLVEPTWGSGYLAPKKQWLRKVLSRLFNKPFISSRSRFIQAPNYSYFLVAPESLLETHLPADPMWQLVEYPISVNTFESKDWIFYTSTMDSSYQRRVDAAEYVSVLDRYESMSDLRFLQQLGKQSHAFNPDNTRLLGLSLLQTAHAYEQSSGDLEKQLEDCQEARRLYTVGIKQLRRHQKTARTEWNKTAKISRSKISKTLRKPLSKRIAQSERSAKAAAGLQNSANRRQKGHVSQMKKWSRKMAAELRPFKQPVPASSTNIELVEQHVSNLNAHLLQVAAYQDSVVMARQQIQSLSNARVFFLRQLFEEYERFESLSQANISAIEMVSNISVLSESMHRVDSVGAIIETLNNHRKELETVILQQKNTIKRHHASILSLSRKVQRLVLHICKRSGNQQCDSSIYEVSNQAIRSVYQTNLALEEAFLARIKEEKNSAKELRRRLTGLLETLELNAAYIDAYREARIDGIQLKLRKSRSETGKLIRQGQQGIKHANRTISALKAEIRKNKSAG